MSAPNIWRRHLWRWLPALLFFLLTLGFWSYYRLSDIRDEVGLLEQRIARKTEVEQRLADRRQRLQGSLTDAQENRQRVEDLYQNRFSTQRSRLTGVIAEVRRLASQVGLAPKTVSYPEQSINEYGLEEKAFVFNVEGSYASLRGLINSLELTETFLTLERVSLTENATRTGNRLGIALRISTLFAVEDRDDGQPPAEAGT